MRPSTLFASLFLGLIAFGHTLRLLLQIEVVVDQIVIPMWPSVLAIAVPLGLAIWLWRDGVPGGAPLGVNS